MRKLITYDSKKAEAFNAFFNLTKKVSSDLEMRTASTWETRARSQVGRERQPVTEHAGGGSRPGPRATPDPKGPARRLWTGGVVLPEGGVRAQTPKDGPS